MAFREVRVFEVREVLRLWLRGEGLRAVERLAGVDRKTVRRYLDAAIEAGLARDGGEVQLSDEFIGVVVEAVRPHRRDGHGDAWRLLIAHHDQVKAWLDDDLTAVKVRTCWPAGGSWSLAARCSATRRRCAAQGGPGP